MLISLVLYCYLCNLRNLRIVLGVLSVLAVRLAHFRNRIAFDQNRS